MLEHESGRLCQRVNRTWAGCEQPGDRWARHHRDAAGETLTATTDDIEDEDGMTAAVFAYQWVRSGTDIDEATSFTYTVTDDDEGKAHQGASHLHRRRRGIWTDIPTVQ